MSNAIFDIDEVREAAEKLDLSDRGSDEEYNRVLLAEFAAFARLRRRAMLGQELMDDLMKRFNRMEKRRKPKPPRRCTGCVWGKFEGTVHFCLWQKCVRELP